jgi:hypothetical protein
LGVCTHQNFRTLTTHLPLAALLWLPDSAIRPPGISPPHASLVPASTELASLEAKGPPPVDIRR